MGMGKSAADALPELRRKGLTDAGRGLYTLSGKTLDALEVAQALRLQVRPKQGWLCACWCFRAEVAQALRLQVHQKQGWLCACWCSRVEVAQVLRL